MVLLPPPPSSTLKLHGQRNPNSKPQISIFPANPTLIDELANHGQSPLKICDIPRSLREREQPCLRNQLVLLAVDEGGPDLRVIISVLTFLLVF